MKQWKQRRETEEQHSSWRHLHSYTVRRISIPTSIDMGPEVPLACISATGSLSCRTSHTFRIAFLVAYLRTLTVAQFVEPLYGRIFAEIQKDNDGRDESRSWGTLPAYSWEELR
jgi:hypothetical protein